MQEIVEAVNAKCKQKHSCLQAPYIPALKGEVLRRDG